MKKSLKIYWKFPVFLLVLVVLSSCTHTQKIVAERDKLFVNSNTKIRSVVLKKGGSIVFGEYDGEFFQSDSTGAKRDFIGGYDTNYVWREIPAEDVAIVRGTDSRTEPSQAVTAGFLTVVLSSPVLLIAILLGFMIFK